MPDLKFYQITDLHHYAHELGIEGKAFESICLSDQKCLAETGAMIDAYFDKIIEDTETNIVLITGDVTCNGAMESHRDLLPKLYRLKDAGKKVYLTTVTHDYYMENGNGTGKAEKCVGDEILTATRTERDELLEIYKDFGLSEAISIHKPSHSYCVKLQEGYRLLCLNDDGDEFFCGYYDDCLEWIKEQIDDAKANRDYIFAVTHHPVIPPTPIYPYFSRRDMLGDFEKTSEFFADNGIKFIFTGHTHMMNIAKIITPKGNELYDINTCSAVGYPNAMRKVVMTDSKVQVDSVRIDSFDWNLKGKTIDEYTKEKFLAFLNAVFDSAAYDIDKLAVLSTSFSMTPEQIYKMKSVIVPGGKFLQKATFGTFGKIFALNKYVDPSIKDRNVKDFVLEVITNVFYGDEPYTPDTPEYKAVEALINKRIKKVLKLKNGTEKIEEILDMILDGVLYNAPPSDWQGTFVK